ncbi:iron-containing alcohol dehydrogenase [Aurantimonas sp. Leaf443]|uniref:iron-containing alcohol dehydrogenase n=1 Tax=Aurantimonas sp. Leaf443 TaxID=1736378 RepID=UPI0012E3AF96|nr:iron-containing alcohol dehydrogenase [Aurantimonas sp. Leaf443]
MVGDRPQTARAGAPAGGWTALIDEIVDGRWSDPATGRTMTVPYDSVVIAESLAGREAELVASVDLPGRLAVVADAATYEALGRRVAEALKDRDPTVIVLDHPHADMANVAALREKLRSFNSAVAVGSGTVNDLVKYVTAEDGRRYCVFGTAASMNGYTSTTASITLDSGLKVSLPAQAPAGFFVDLGVSAAAPRRLAAAGFGDCLARSVAQVDWWLSHRLFGTTYSQSAYAIEEADERELNARAAGIGRGEVEAVGYLYRVLTLCGLGVSFTGLSNHGSMGEHQISHYIDCFAGKRHPGTLHGQQVGVASLTMARLQQRILDSETPPGVKATIVDEADMVRRMGPAIAAQCLEELRRKAFTPQSASAFNDRIAGLWPELREELRAFVIPEPEMRRMLSEAGGATTAEELGLDLAFWREAVIHSREMRNRFSMIDIAADAGWLEDFAAEER